MFSKPRKKKSNNTKSTDSPFLPEKSVVKILNQDEIQINKFVDELEEIENSTVEGKNYCELCDRHFNASVKRHERSKRHLKNKFKILSQFGYCELCKIDYKGSQDGHELTKEHKRNKKKLNY